jgi:DNA-binding FadR family transcriptional regulator
MAQTERLKRQARPRAVTGRAIPPAVPAKREGISFSRNMHSSLAHQIGRDIVGGLYPPGSLLPNEVEMCSRFSVSRTTLREAYSVLNAKSLIVARPKVGTRVRPKGDWNMLDPDVLSWHFQTVPTQDYIDDLYVLRQIVEPAAAALAATARAPETLERIAAAFADMERFKDGGGDLIAADLQFHLAILEATGNHFIGALGSLIHAALLGTFEISWEGAARMRDGRLQQHWVIFEAIRNGDPEQARERMSILLRDSIRDVRESLRKRGNAGARPRAGSPRRSAR